MLILGWDMKQWAAAKEYHDRLNPEKDIPATLAGALEIRRFWQTRRCDEPGKSGLVVPKHCEPHMPGDWLVGLFSQAPRTY